MATEPKVLDANGRPLAVGARVKLDFGDSTSGIGTVSSLHDDRYGKYAAVEFSVYTTLSDCAGDDGLCADLELIDQHDKEESRGDLQPE